MVWKKLFALIALAVSITVFAENSVYNKLSQDYETTLKLLRTAGVKEHIVSSDSTTLQTLLKFKEISADYFALHIDFVSEPKFSIIPFFFRYVKDVLTLLFINDNSSFNNG